MSRAVPFVPQFDDTDCGAAALSSILLYFGRSESLPGIRAAISDAANGPADARALLRVARAQGLGARGVSVDLDGLGRLKLPAILHWNFQHFVVLRSVSPRGLHIVDPALGPRRVSLADADTQFTGIALEFDGDRRRFRRRSVIARYVRATFGARWSEILRSLALAIVAQAGTLTVPIVTGAVVDLAGPGVSLPLTLFTAGCLSIVTFAAVSHVRDQLVVRMDTDLDDEVGSRFFRHLMRQPLTFFATRPVGDLMMRMNSNTTVRAAASGAILGGAIDGGTVILYSTTLFLGSRRMGLIALLAGLALVALALASRRRIEEIASQSSLLRSSSQSALTEMLQAVEVVKSSGASSRLVDEWSEIRVQELNAYGAERILMSRIGTLSRIVRSVGSLAILAGALQEVEAGSLSTGRAVALAGIGAGLLAPISGLGTALVSLYSVEPHLQRIEEVLEASPEDAGGQPYVVGDSPIGPVEMRNVTFSYPNTSTPAVIDASVTIPAGQLVAIVGTTGAGKSTLARLLLGLYVADSGRCFVDGTDVTAYEAESWRRAIGIVTQAPGVLRGTIWSNIALLDPDRELESVHRAAQIACLHEDIEAMPMGYLTQVAESGRSLSGGQQQRLALARALCGEPRLLVLDEATSQLDPATERRVLENLRRIDATVVLITHRPSVMQAADRVVVMDSGRVVDTGKHSTLIRRSPSYRSIVRGGMG